MEIELEIPDDIVQQLNTGWEDLPRKTLEALAAEGYRFGLITSAQVQRMLDHKSRWETEEFLKEHNCYLNYNEDDLKRDVAAIRKTPEK